MSAASEGTETGQSGTVDSVESARGHRGCRKQISYCGLKDTNMSLCETNGL